MTFIETVTAMVLALVVVVAVLAAAIILLPKFWNSLRDAWERLVGHMRYGR